LSIKVLFGHLGSWLEDNWANLVLTIGTIGFALSGVLAGKSEGDWKWLYASDYGKYFSVSCVLSVIGGFASWRKQRSTSELKETNRRMEQDKQSYSEILPDELWVLSNRVLRLGVSERISVFRYRESESENDEAGGLFILITRQAQNPKFQRPGRKVYPEDQGVLGAVLNEGKMFCDDFPDPESQHDEYFNQVERHLGIPKKIAKQRTMQARAYAGFRINDFNSNLAGVIVFESTNPSGLNIKELENLMSGEECDRLARLLERSKPFEPKPTIALMGGY